MDIRKDSERFKNRNSLMNSNANLFVSNNNPFLVTTYGYQTNTAKLTDITNIENLISTIVQNISSVIDLNDFSLAINTITNIPTSTSVTISTTTFQVTAENTYFNGSTIFTDETYFNTLYGTNFFTTTADIDELTVSSIIAGDETVNYLTVNSTMNVSTFITGNFNTSNAYISTLNVSTLIGDTAEANFLTINSLMTTSSMNVNNGYVSSLFTSTFTGNNMIVNSTLVTSTLSTTTVIAQDFIFSSFCMIPSTISSAVTTFNSSILLCLNGSYWKIPIEPA